ncbi:MAG: Oligopeptide transport system permease protein OppC [Chlamydiia bacterium]|nr:Oligopeptide transport system permease protein OppC [Chlamydiia bacterium]MCH9615564.1 Oligopeptide transport system permease protein OppC [Chlamydiia bacterium]MCH9629219.1 Oligopeptide transport system permease protein OppC [Chlamydiia bacterium]
MAPCGRFWFGTDELGRDIFTRTWWGLRISLFIGIAAAIIDIGIGVLYGAFSAWMGGKIDEIMMRLADILFALPHLLIVILLMVILGPGLGTIILALTCTGWITMARIVRSQVLQLKSTDFVLAAKFSGASNWRILVRHLIPNVSGTIITTMALTIPVAIFHEAFLSFLGLGIQVPVASLGTMAHDGLTAMKYYPWRLFFPAAFISLTMLAFNLIGDALQEVFDPRVNDEAVT